MQVPYFPPVQSVADFPISKCQDILRKAAGLPDLQVDVKAVKTWNMSAQVAQSFQVRPQIWVHLGDCMLASRTTAVTASAQAMS